MRNKKYGKILGLSLLLVSIIICVPLFVIGYINYFENPQDEPGESIDQDLIYETGEIVFLKFEREFYGIVADNGNHYDPINLSPEFQIEGLRVIFLGEELDLFSYHMWGTIIRILFIQKLGD